MSFQNLHMYVKSTVVSTSLNNYNRGGCAILWANKVVTGLTLATHLNKQDSFYVTQKINCILNPGQIMRHLCKV